MEKFKNSKFEVGIDEAGRGPLFGPVFSACVMWDSKIIPEFIKDSKKLSKKKRNLAYEWILKNIKYFGIGYATNTEIDKINILEATKLSMKRALDNINLKLLTDKIKVNSIIIDGCNWEKNKNFFTDNKDIILNSVIKGDTKYLSIASASILAKVSHDKYIIDLINKNPEFDTNYGLSSNMGYGTKIHINGIKTFGFTNYHRKSFKIK